MNREIKFRGKRIDNGEWVYGYLADEDYINDINSIDLSSIEVDRDTIGQFTGLFDKNGKEIYEGDILGANGKIIGWIKGGARGYCYDVVYINYPTGEKRWSLYGTVVEDFNNKIEVISNIHDNPELINS
ncbi:YopX family protein [Bacteroides fragilis]|nr:YopX family protein [Bacteroides fragilis]